jgi:hypothetical protein
MAVYPRKDPMSSNAAAIFGARIPFREPTIKVLAQILPHQSLELAALFDKVRTKSANFGERTQMVRTIQLTVSAFCLMTAALLLSSCITISGPSSGEMKRRALSFEAVQLIPSFYPNGVPSDPHVVYPDLRSSDLRRVQASLQRAMNTVASIYNKNRKEIGNPFGVKTGVTVRAPKVLLVLNYPIGASSDSAGIVRIDVGLIQSIFRGALLEGFGFKETTEHSSDAGTLYVSMCTNRRFRRRSKKMRSRKH